MSISLFIGLPPFLGIEKLDSIQLNPVDPPSLFAHFWRLRSAGRVTEALQFCDLILEVIPAADFDSHLRQTNARAMALRDLSDLRGAYRTHASARPLLALVEPRYAGDHYHGLGVTLTRLGESLRAFKCFETARRLHEGDPVKLAHTDVNTAELLASMGKVAQAHAILGGVSEPSMRAHVEAARALAYEAVEDYPKALRCIASSIELLAPTGDIISIEETRRTGERILGKVGR
jgi:tetratricopeptide (TPR) repeat protein